MCFLGSSVCACTRLELQSSGATIMNASASSKSTRLAPLWTRDAVQPGQGAPPDPADVAAFRKPSGAGLLRRLCSSQQGATQQQLGSLHPCMQ